MGLRLRFVLLAGAVATVNCSNGSNDCPGLCPVETIHPTMTIQVDGGVAAVASAKVVSGPCSHLLVHSAGEAGASASYAAVEVTYNGAVDIPPLCLVELTSLDGQTVVVTTSVTVSTSQLPCCPHGSCCSKSSVVSLHHQVVFDQPVQSISFPPAPDQGLDGGAAGAALDTEASTHDASDRNSAEDIPENAAKDAAEDAARDEATAEIMGAPPDAEQILDLASAF
jgi:hypothetical protein